MELPEDQVPGNLLLPTGSRDYFGDDVVVLYHDNYYRKQDGIPFEQRVTVNYDHPDSLETELLVEHLKQLKAGKIHRVSGL